MNQPTSVSPSNVITGLGLITAAGTGVEENYGNFQAKRSGVRPIIRFTLPEKYRTGFAGLIDPVALRSRLPLLSEELNEEDLKQDYVKAAALVVHEALSDAGILEDVKKNGRRTALIIASSLGNYLNVSELVKDYYINALYRITSLIHGMNSYLPARLSSLFGITGPNFFVSSSCTSSANAILQGDNLIHRGFVDRVVVCGVDVCLDTGTFHLWNKIRVLSKRNEQPSTACRPYCSTRDGIVVSEAAGCVIIERSKDAKRPAYATIDGIGMANGAHDFLKPSKENITLSINDALEISKTPKDKIDFIAGSAAGSPWCDHFDSEAVCEIFGERASEIPLFSYKSHLGTTFGTQAVSEGILALKSFHHNQIPEVRNIFELDERVKANVCYDWQQYGSMELQKMLFVNYGFAGNHMCIVYGKGEK